MVVTGPVKGPASFRDLVGKLDVLTVECDKCDRFRRYYLDRLIERYGIDGKRFARFDASIAHSLREIADRPNDASVGSPGSLRDLLRAGHEELSLEALGQPDVLMPSRQLRYSRG